jgi:hypothetical protein
VAPALRASDAPTESAAEGVARASRILAAAKNARWPMYLRNVKQILRQYRAEGAGPNEPGGFDERRYGFGGLMDLLKALQRVGVVRIERDRRGGLRVFQGAAFERQASVALEGLPQVDPALEAELAEADLAEAALAVATLEDRDAPVVDGPDRVQVAAAPWPEPEPVEGMVAREPVPVDTTAELLGRATTRKPRTPTGARPPRAAAASTKRAAQKKPLPRRPTRGRKALATITSEEPQS